MSFVPQTVRVSFRNLEGRVNMDLKAVVNLELLPQYSRGGVASAQDILQATNFLFATPASDMRKARGAAAPATKRHGRVRSTAATVFDLFHCKTAGGARSLRNSLLQPYSDPDTLLGRLDMVDILLADEESYYTLCEIMPQFTDLDHVTAGMVQAPVEPNIRTTQMQIHLILTLGYSLQLMPKLEAIVATLKQKAEEQQAEKKKADERQARNATATPAPDALASTSSLLELLTDLLANLGERHYSGMLLIINEVLDLPKSEVLRKGANSAQYARYRNVFAVRSGLNGLLDVARRTFLEAADGQPETTHSQLQEQVNLQRLALTFCLLCCCVCSELNEERARLASQLGLLLGDIELLYTNARGFHLSISAPRLDALDPALTAQFIQRYNKGKRVLCTTEQIISLDQRQAEAYTEICELSAKSVNRKRNKREWTRERT